MLSCPYMINKTKITIISASLATFLSATAMLLIFNSSQTSQTHVSLGNNPTTNVAGVKAEPEPVAPVLLRFFFVGDIMMDRYVGTLIKRNGFDYLFKDLMAQDKTFFSDFDLVSGNLESAVTNKGAHYPPVAVNDFAVAPELVGKLQGYNFNHLTIANNHITDQGVKGLEETRQNLDSLKIFYSGSADSAVDANSISHFDLQETKVATLAYSMVYHPINLTEAVAQIKKAKNRAELVIVNIHWGEEYQIKFNAEQQIIARTFIDAGADIIIGHHPHVVQGMEIYRERPIFYSLGNFIFDQYFSVETQRGLALELDWSHDQWTVTLHPLKSVQSRPSLLLGEAKTAYLEGYLQRSSLDQAYHSQLLAGQLVIK